MKFKLKIDIFEITFSYDKNFLNIKIHEEKFPNKKYKSIQVEFNDINEEDLNFEEFDKIINEFNKEQAACPCPCSDLIRVYQKDDGKKYLVFIVKNEKNENNVFQKIVEKEIQLLNVKYYLTIGSDKKRLNESPYYTYLEKDKFNLTDIKMLIEKENLDAIYEMDSFKMKNKDGFFEKIGDGNYELLNSELILEFHCNSIKKQPILNGIDNDQKYTEDIIKLKENLNKYSQNVINYDLIYLYASPIVCNGKEEPNPISYREEIEIILNIMKKKGKKFNCLFECIGSKSLKEILSNKKTKVLHISSHGKINRKTGDKWEYSLVIEDFEEKSKFGEKKEMNEQSLRGLLNWVSHKIKDIDVVILSTCHSGGLHELFKEHKPKNIIYVDKKTKIGDYTSVKFTDYFYQELLDGCPIEDCYNISIKKLKCDTDILYYNVDRCCCNHKHSEKCLFSGSKPNSKFHQNYCLGDESCKCKSKYEECHMHDKECAIVEKFKEEIERNKNEHKKPYHIKEYDNYVKLCCCDPDISHNEIAKLKFESYGDEKNKDINIFKYNTKGKIKINDNVSIDFDAKRKYYSIIGRKVLVSEIFKEIFVNENNNYFIVLFGEKGMHKQVFAESTCVYLFERKIIHKYEIYAIKSDLDLVKMKDKIYFSEKLNSHDKSVKIIKFFNIEKIDNLVDNILNLSNLFQKYKNLYFIILCDLELKEDNIKKIESDIKHVKCFDAKIREPILLVKYYFNLYNPNCVLEKENELKNALEKKRAKPKQLEAIAKLLTFGQITEEKIIELVNNDLESIVYEGKQQSLEFEPGKEDMLSQYYLLSKFPSGLPNSFITLIFKGIEKNLKAENYERLIKVNQRNDWKYINNDISFKKSDMLLPYAKKYLLKTLKLYAVLLDYYIDKKRDEVNFKDENIHIIFNSFNNTEIWRSHIKDLLKNEKDENVKNIDVNIFNDGNYIIMKHKENISCLLNHIVNNLGFFLSGDDSVEKYLEEILILYPSALFFKKACKDILQMCKCFCLKCSKYFEDNKNTNSYNNFVRLENKLLLFQYSMGEIEKIDIEKLDEDLKFELMFLTFLIPKSSKQLLEKDLETLIRSGNIKDKKKLSLLNYEFAKLNFSVREFERAEKFLNTAIENMLLYILENLNEQINGEKLPVLFKKYFDKKQNKKTDLNKLSLEKKYLFRMIIDLCQVFKLTIDLDNNDSLIQEKIDSLDIIDDKESNLYKEANLLRTELYNLKQPDIIMLNANPLKDNYSLLSNGIYANLNNQFYILKQLKESKEKDKNKEIESYIRIKSKILNSDNLSKSLKNSGEILIIQSDDFNDNGDIILETEEGKSELLPKHELFDYIREKIEYKVLILCFNNSSKLEESLRNNNKINYEYIVSFEYFDYYHIERKSLVEYNKLCIQFIIDFIKLSSKYTNIKTIFDKAKAQFMYNKNKKFLMDIPGSEFIYLRKKNVDTFPQINYFQEKQEIFLYENLPEITENYEYNNYYFEIEEILYELNKNKKMIKNCCAKKKKKFIKIGIELIKYLFRHKSFIDYYDIDLNKISFDNFKKLVKNAKLKVEKDGQKNSFYFIYNCKPNNSLETILNEITNKNGCYFILYDMEHKNGDCKSEKDSESESDEFKVYSVFNFDSDGNENDSDELNNENIAH